MLVVSILSTLALLLIILANLNSSDAKQVPLKIIWNTQTQGPFGCEVKFGIPINVRQYGMLENSVDGSDGWRGEIITVFYKDSGRWPYIDHGQGGEWINGGLPQVP